MFKSIFVFQTLTPNIYTQLFLVMAERVPNLWFSGITLYLESGVEQGFSSIFAKFLSYNLIIFQSSSSVLHFEKSSKIAKNEGEPLFDLPSTHFYSLRIPETRISGNCSATKLFHAWKVRLIFKQYDGGSEDSLTDGHEIFFCT